MFGREAVQIGRYKEKYMHLVLTPFHRAEMKTRERMFVLLFSKSFPPYSAQSRDTDSNRYKYCIYLPFQALGTDVSLHGRGWACHPS